MFLFAGRGKGFKARRQKFDALLGMVDKLMGQFIPGLRTQLVGANSSSQLCWTRMGAEGLERSRAFHSKMSQIWNNSAAVKQLSKGCMDSRGGAENWGVGCYCSPAEISVALWSSAVPHQQGQFPTRWLQFACIPTSCAGKLGAAETKPAQVPSLLISLCVLQRASRSQVSADGKTTLIHP